MALEEKIEDNPWEMLKFHVPAQILSMVTAASVAAHTNHLSSSAQALATGGADFIGYWPLFLALRYHYNDAELVHTGERRRRDVLLNYGKDIGIMATAYQGVRYTVQSQAQDQGYHPVGTSVGIQSASFALSALGVFMYFKFKPHIDHVLTPLAQKAVYPLKVAGALATIPVRKITTRKNS